MKPIVVTLSVVCFMIASLLILNNGSYSSVSAGPLDTETSTATATATATTTFAPTATPPCWTLTKAPKLLQPANNAKTSQQKITLTWKKAPCQPRYTVEIRRDSDTGTLVQTKANLKALTFTTKTLARDVLYFWHVSACNAQGCVSSPFRKFTITIPPTPAPTRTPTRTATPGAQPTATKTPSANCSPSYPDFCIPPPPPDLDCSDPPIAGHHNFTVLPPDPHHLDADHDGLGCES